MNTMAVAGAVGANCSETNLTFCGQVCPRNNLNPQLRVVSQFEVYAIRCHDALSGRSLPHTVTPSVGTRCLRGRVALPACSHGQGACVT